MAEAGTKRAASASKRAGPKTVARSYFEAVTRRDVEAMVGHWEHGAIDHFHGVADLRIPDGYRQWFSGLFRAFPDFTMEVLEIVAAGQLASVRWRATGTFNGTARFEGLEPNGARIEMEGCDMLTIRDGLIRDNHAYMNGSELARQLGALPPAGSPAERGLTAVVNARTQGTRALARLRERLQS